MTEEQMLAGSIKNSAAAKAKTGTIKVKESKTIPKTMMTTPTATT